MAAARSTADRPLQGAIRYIRCKRSTGYNQGMSVIYSTDEAKARFPKILRHVRAGHRVTIICDGKAVAEIHPVERDLWENLTTEEWFDYLRQRGIVSGSRGKWQPPEGVEPSPGALERFLAERG